MRNAGAKLFREQLTVTFHEKIPADLIVVQNSTNISTVKLKLQRELSSVRD